MKPYRIPAQEHRINNTIVNSRFIATVARVDNVDDVKVTLTRVRREMSDASHHVYAFRVGHGNSVVEGMSDDGEPSGTAGPPVMAVLRGTDIGDILVIVTRYFGGTKLGTGGLVRAYSDSARMALETLPTEEKIERKILGLEISYARHEVIKRLAIQHQGTVLDEVFGSEVALIIQFATEHIDAFVHDLTEATAGQCQPIVLSDG